MKSLFSLVFVLWFCLLGQSQNPLFVGFETTKPELVKFLKNRGTVKYQEKGNMLIANSGDNCLEYKFNPSGTLYKIEMFRNYSKKKEALENLDNMIHFFEIQQTTLFKEVDTPEKVKHVAIVEGIINDIYLLKSPEGYQVKVIKRNPANDPLTDESDDLAPSESFSLSLSH